MPVEDVYTSLYPNVKHFRILGYRAGSGACAHLSIQRVRLAGVGGDASGCWDGERVGERHPSIGIRGRRIPVVAHSIWVTAHIGEADRDDAIARGRQAAI